jgi:hypothetical protein
LVLVAAPERAFQTGTVALLNSFQRAAFKRRCVLAHERPGSLSRRIADWPKSRPESDEENWLRYIHPAECCLSAALAPPVTTRF